MPLYKEEKLKNKTEQSNSEQGKIVFLSATAFSDAACVADSVMDSCCVLLNTEKMQDDEKTRLLDYLSGAVHILGFEMFFITENAYLFAPQRTVIK